MRVKLNTLLLDLNVAELGQMIDLAQHSISSVATLAIPPNTPRDT